MGYIKDLSKYENLRLWRKTTINALLAEWVENRGEETASITGEDKLTYRLLDEKSTAMAYGFQKEGLEKGDKVILQLSNGNEYLITLFALFKAGLIPVLALPAHRDAELGAIAETAEPKAYILNSRYQGFDYLPMARKLADRYDCIKHLFVDGDFDIESSREKSLTDVRSEEGKLPVTDPYDIAFFLLSGGSTGVPKLIGRTHAEYMYLCKLCQERCKMTADDVYMVALPCEHNFPMGDPGFLGTLDTGGTIVFCENISPDEILELIESHGVTMTAMVPAMVNMCMELYEIDGDYDISSLRLLQVGGSVFDDVSAQKVMNTFKDTTLMQVYGTSEGLIITSLVTDTKDKIMKYQGKALPDEPLSQSTDITEIKIIKEDGTEAADGEFGELLCKGPYIIDGYYKREDANKASFTPDGFYKTGDKAMRTYDGYYKFSGRIKEQINRAGEKIMPVELEEYLLTHNNITEAAVIGVPDPVLGNKIVSFFVSDNGKEVTTEEVYEFLGQKGVAQYKYPDECYTLKALPLTAVGKKDAKALLKIAQGEV